MRIEHLAMDREQRRLELEVLEANALHYESQTEVSAGRAALEIDGVGTGPVLRERVGRLADYHGSITHLRADIDQELSDYRPEPGGPTHPSDPSRCVNELGWRCGPEDCVINHPASEQHDPLSGDLIPAGQDAELERMGHDMAAPGSAFAELVRPEIEAMGNPIRDLAIRQGIIPAEPDRPAPCTNCAPLRAGMGMDRVDESDLSEPCVECGAVEPPIGSDEEEEERATGEDDLVWHPRTMRDARKGDQIRPAGSDMPNGTAVTDRYWPPQPAVPTRYGPLPADRDTWHVVPGAKHWDDHVVQPGEVWLCLDGGAPRNVDPAFPIEILLTRAEIAAIELLGWDNREETRS